MVPISPFSVLEPRYLRFHGTSSYISISGDQYKVFGGLVVFFLILVLVWYHFGTKSGGTYSFAIWNLTWLELKPLKILSGGIFGSRPTLNQTIVLNIGLTIIRYLNRCSNDTWILVNFHMEYHGIFDKVNYIEFEPALVATAKPIWNLNFRVWYDQFELNS